MMMIRIIMIIMIMKAVTQSIFKLVPPNFVHNFFLIYDLSPPFPSLSSTFFVSPQTQIFSCNPPSLGQNVIPLPFWVTMSCQPIFRVALPRAVFDTFPNSTFYKVTYVLLQWLIFRNGYYSRTASFACVRHSDCIQLYTVVKNSVYIAYITKNINIPV